MAIEYCESGQGDCVNTPYVNTQPTRVIYVGGIGRSGSTLIERALASADGVCGLGELVHIWERGIRGNQMCGCGMQFHSCPFWTEVGYRAFGGWANVDVPRVESLANRVDTIKSITTMIPGGNSLRPAKEALSEYAGYYARIYDAAAEITGCRVVVDTSKRTSMAFVLTRTPKIDVSLLHVVRDPRAVAYSWTKRVRRPEIIDEVAYMPRYSPRYIAGLYLRHNLLLSALKFQGMRTLRVRYEDFVDDPANELARIGVFADLRGVSNIVDVESRVLHTRTSHTVSGNPMRFDTGDISISRDDRWIDKFPSRYKNVVRMMTSPLLARYGYSFRS